MRTIILDDTEAQIQRDDTGREYVYRKDYLYKGDMKEEFSLALIFSRGKGKGAFYAAKKELCETAKQILPIQPGGGDFDLHGRGEVLSNGVDSTLNVGFNGGQCACAS